MPRRAGRPECGKRAASVNRERNGSIATQQTTSARQANRFRVINATRDVALAESSKKAADPLSRGIGLIGYLVTARLLGPRAFGVVAIGLSITFVAQFLSDGGLGPSLVRRPEPPSTRMHSSSLAPVLSATRRRDSC